MPRINSNASSKNYVKNHGNIIILILAWRPPVVAGRSAYGVRAEFPVFARSRGGAFNEVDSIKQIGCVGPFSTKFSILSNSHNFGPIDLDKHANIELY